MSKVPTPKEIPPTPQQVDRTLQAVIGHAQHLIADDPRHFANLQASFLALYTNPTFQLILGIPSQVPPTPPPQKNQQQSELSELKSTIQALSKAVADLQPKVNRAQAPPAQSPPHTGSPSAQGKGPSSPPPHTYASQAAQKPRPSLVLNTGAVPIEPAIRSNLVTRLNKSLFLAGHTEFTLSAVRFTNKGNLVLTANHTNTQSQLNAVAGGLAAEVERFLKAADIPTPPPITAKANVKWSKILINSVPVGILDNRGPWTPEECHRSLSAHNPIYPTLKITQKPSWVRSPSTLKRGSQSSLVMAFEDPDGSARRALLASKHLYVHGTCAKVSHWKEAPRTSTKPPSSISARTPSLVLEPRSSAPPEETAESAIAQSPTTLPVARNITKPANPQPATRSSSRRHGGPE